MKLKLINEDLLNRYDGKLFFDMFLEYLAKTNTIRNARYYFDKEREDEFDWNKRMDYVKEFPVADVKKDLHSFVTDFSNELKSLPEVDHTHPDISPFWGLSDYVYIYFNPPTDKKLLDFYNENPNVYSRIKVRFSDHEEVGHQEDDTTNRRRNHKNADIPITWENKTFLQAADEMLAAIKNHINGIHEQEKEYLDSLEKEKAKDKTEKLKRKQIRLRISEKVNLDERLEEVAPNTFATDSATDIANWILNKPKPYRILYDAKYDVWCIADAMSQTHKDMSIDLFDSDYLYGVAKDLDRDIANMRKLGDFNSGYTDAEVYSDFGFDKYNLKGLFFIPKDMNYRDYEESGFYSHEVPITTGTIFVSNPYEFSENGIFKDLYRKLDRMDALTKSLRAIYAECRKEYGENWLNYFYDEAEEYEYDEDEVQEFLNNYGILNILK